MTDDRSKSMTGKFTTTTDRVPVASDEHSRTVGRDGAVVLHDVYSC
jgi:catalase